jgi:hypothetical protein
VARDQAELGEIGARVFGSGDPVLELRDPSCGA